MAVSTARRAALAAALVLGVTLAGCVENPPVSEPPPAPTAPEPTSEPDTSDAPAFVQPAGDPEVVATGLTSPWSVVPLPGRPGEALISERDTARILHLDGTGAHRSLGTVPDVAHGGEGGLLGLALRETSGVTWLYAYLTTATDNRIVRMVLGDDLTLGTPSTVLTGLAVGRNHHGGRLAFGPDGMLYATVGDAGNRDLAQDAGSLGGKILRMTPSGAVPADNPFPHSLVYTLGHRNPQGIAWDATGQMWAAEFGQNTWDEVNRITAGANYGWPEVEGRGGVDGFVDPVAQWPTSEASPSALAAVGETLFVAALKGERVWALYPLGDGAEYDAVAWFTGEFGRIREVIPAPGGMWFVTNNTDGRGDAQGGDDRILFTRLVALQEG